MTRSLNLITAADLDALFGEDFFDGMPSPTADAMASGRAGTVNYEDERRAG